MIKNKPSKLKALGSWCLYDWANSAFPTVIITFIFSSYFSKVVANNPIDGMAVWSAMISASAIAVAIFAPIIGIIIDKNGQKKSWIFLFTIICSIASASLWFVEGHSNFVIICIVLVGVANFSFEMSMVIYNSMLAKIAPKAELGWWSGMGWSLGYFGGLASLGIILMLFVNPESPPLELDPKRYEHIRISGPFVALWFLFFSIPLFIWFIGDKKKQPNIDYHAKNIFLQLTRALKHIKKRPDIWRFLLGRMIYIDGLNTLLSIGGIYAAGTFNFSFKDILIFGIAINISAGIGSSLAGKIDDLIGPRRTIMISLSSITIISIILIVIKSEFYFWIFGIALGLFVGPIQSASRVLMAKLATKKMQTQMFGFYAFTGKVTAFLGPAILTTITLLFESQRAGMITIIPFFLIGFYFIWKMRDNH